MKLTFRTTCTKSLGFWGERPWIWRVQASKEEACPTNRIFFPDVKKDKGVINKDQVCRTCP